MLIQITTDKYKNYYVYIKVVNVTLIQCRRKNNNFQPRLWPSSVVVDIYIHEYVVLSGQLNCAFNLALFFAVRSLFITVT